MDFFYFQFHLEAAPDATSYTYGIQMDTDDDGTYDFCISTYGENSSVRLYHWNGTAWIGPENTTFGAGFFTPDAAERVVQFAVDRGMIGYPTGNWTVRAVTYAGGSDAFEDEGTWREVNAPEPWPSEGDWTEAGGIPELQLFITMAGVILLFAVMRRRHLNGC
jgi:hypothetical protein